MKKIFSMFFMFVMFALSGAALATDETVDTACGGNQCWDSFEKISVGGSANFGGFGASMFEGDEGYNFIEKGGSANTNLTLNVEGDNCGPDCQSGGFSFQAQAGEWVTVKTGALGEQSGVPVTAVNQGGSFANVEFQFGQQNIAPE